MLGMVNLMARAPGAPTDMGLSGRTDLRKDLDVDWSVRSLGRRRDQEHEQGDGDVFRMGG